MNINDALKIVKPISDQIVADYLAKSPEQQRAEALAAVEEAQTKVARAQLDAVARIVIANLTGLPEPEEARRIISNMPTGETQ